MAIKTTTMITIQTQVDTVILSLEAGLTLQANGPVFVGAGGRAERVAGGGIDPSGLERLPASRRSTSSLEPFSTG
jgi:hypothetical protein